MAGYQSYTEAVTAALDGRQDAFSWLYEKTSKEKYYIAIKYMKDPNDASDVLQDAYIKAWKSLGSLDEPEKFPGWVGQIVANTALSALRKTRPVTFSDMSGENEEGDEFVYDIEDEAIDRQPELNYTTNERQEIIRSMIDSLTDEQRLCVMMYYIEEMSVKEIAETLGCSENTVKSRLNYGRKNIRQEAEELKKKGYNFYSIAPVPLLLILLHSELASALGVTAAAGGAVATGAAVGVAGGVAATGAATGLAGGSVATGAAVGLAGGAAATGAAAGLAGGSTASGAAAGLAGGVAATGAAAGLAGKVAVTGAAANMAGKAAVASAATGAAAGVAGKAAGAATGAVASTASGIVSSAAGTVGNIGKSVTSKSHKPGKSEKSKKSEKPKKAEKPKKSETPETPEEPETPKRDVKEKAAKQKKASGNPEPANQNVAPKKSSSGVVGKTVAGVLLIAAMGGAGYGSYQMMDHFFGKPSESVTAPVSTPIPSPEVKKKKKKETSHVLYELRQTDSREC